MFAEGMSPETGRLNSCTLAQRLVPGGEKLAAQMTLEDMRMTVVERVSE